VDCIVALDTDENINWPVAREIILRILTTHIAEDFAISLLNRLPPEVAKEFPHLPSENPNLTCLIQTKRDTDSNSWYLALKDIEQQFNLGNIGGFTVEFIDAKMCVPQPLRVYPIGGNEHIATFWPQIRMKVLDELSRLEWSTLSVVRFGPSQQASENPVTILIGAPKESKKTWDSITSNIRNIIDDFFLYEIEIVITPAKHPFSSLLDDPEEIALGISVFQSDVEFGSSFGPKDVKTSATVGGTIRLRHSDGKSHHALMSVFHCFRTIVGNGTFKLYRVNGG
jgi:hypothetical protein